LDKTCSVTVRESSPTLVKTPLDAQYRAMASPREADSAHTTALHCSLRHELEILRMRRHCSPEACCGG
jgi:GTP cyclohydrolase III